MTDEDFARIVRLIALQQDVLNDLQAHVYALETYVAEQAGYNAIRFGDLLTTHREDLAGTVQRQHNTRLALLRALLARVEGTPQ